MRAQSKMWIAPNDSGAVGRCWFDACAEPRNGMVEYTRADLSPTREQVEAMVKPLEWRAKSDWHHIAENPFGDCWIKHYAGQTEGNSVWTLYGPGHYGPGNTFPSIYEAKAAAQTDYTARILSALNLPTPNQNETAG